MVTSKRKTKKSATYGLRDKRRKHNPQRLLGTEPYTVGPMAFQLRGAGAMPCGVDWEYFGFATTMRPSTFLALAYQDDLYQGPRMGKMEAGVEAGVTFSPPWIRFTEYKHGWACSGHEGRHRLEIVRSRGGDEPVPVVVEVREQGGETRARNVTDEALQKLNAGAYSEEDIWRKGPLFGPVALVHGRTVALTAGGVARPQRKNSLSGPSAAVRAEGDPPATRSRSMKKSNPTATEVGAIIVEQMGGAGRLRMSLGTTSILRSPDGVQFDYKGAKRGTGNKLIVKYNRGGDDYTMEFWQVRGYEFKEVKRYEGIYADQLVDLFEGFTGLYLTLHPRKNPGPGKPVGHKPHCKCCICKR